MTLKTNSGVIFDINLPVASQYGSALWKLQKYLTKFLDNSRKYRKKTGKYRKKTEKKRGKNRKIPEKTGKKPENTGKKPKKNRKIPGKKPGNTGKTPKKNQNYRETTGSSPEALSELPTIMQYKNRKED